MKNLKALAVFSVTFGVLGGYMVATGTISSHYGADDGKSAAKTNAPQITGVPGSPSATETLRGKQIPAPPLPFGGVIKETLKGSKTWWPPRIVPPQDAPNVQLIMTDDND